MITDALKHYAELAGWTDDLGTELVGYFPNKPLGFRCLWNVKWYDGTKPIYPHEILPYPIGDYLLVELADIGVSNSRAHRLAEKPMTEWSDDDRQWARDTVNYYRANATEYIAPWAPQDGRYRVPIYRSGWEPDNV